jgi:16S rRNA C967 or C1407 C5-methylase (RsmB/RsmF family)/NOL1/NOP2/fmu family ribosome biogenesis protein
MTSLPQDFIKRIQQDPFVPAGLLQALEETAPTSVRLHPQRKSNFQTSDPVAWSSSGIYLKERPAFTYDPLFHAGAYYPQEAGSMYLEKVLEQLALPENPVILDLSAAPGGKSTLIASFLNHKGVLIANEINRSRAYILSENLTKWGYANTFVCNHKPSELSALQGQVDVLVVDAPCSGEGMFRKDHQARAEWHLGNAATCASRQTEIIDEVWPLLKEGGYLIYSTCTFNPEENENQLIHLLEEESAQKIKLPHFEGLQADRHEIGYYFFPNQVKSEGFYIAALQKTLRAHTKHKPSKNSELGAAPKELLAMLNTTHDLQFWQEADQVYVTTPFARSIYGLIKDLKFLKKGIHVATAHKKSWTPGYELTYSLLPIWNFPIKAVEAPEALRILHGESQQWEAPAGFYLVTFEGQAIAMIKQIGQRFNNLHPTEWRIRHLPK